jgi:hypothetical protein
MKNLKNILRIAFSMICLLLFAFSVSGQEKTDSTNKSQSDFMSKITYGIKVGSTLSSFSTEQPHTNFKPGFMAGVFISYKLTASLDLQLEPTYIQQGGNLISILDYQLFLVPDPPYSYEFMDQRITFHNIDVPLLIKYKTSVFGLKVFAVAGPSIAYNIRTINHNEVSARTFEKVPVYFDFNREENISSNIKSWQYGTVGGIGFETPVGKHTLIFDIRYRYSLNKTYPGFSYLGIYQIQGDLRTNTLYFTLGFGF